MRSYSNHNSCAHRHRHTHGRCKSRLSNPFPAKSSSLPPGPPPPHSGSADTCYDRGWKPRDYLPESFPYEHVQIMPLSLLGCWGRLFVFGGEEAAGGCGGGESLSTQTGPSRGSPATWETAAAAPAHSRHFAPNFTTGGELSCRSPFPPPGSPRSCVQPPPVTLPRLNETLPSFIYLSAASLQHPPPPPASSLTDVDDGVRPHRNALKYPGEKPEHQHFHFQPLAQHISSGLAERQTGEKKKKKAQGQVEHGSGRGGEMPRHPP